MLVNQWLVISPLIDLPLWPRDLNPKFNLIVWEVLRLQYFWAELSLAADVFAGDHKNAVAAVVNSSWIFW